ncbi:hypothetical protein AB204_03310 [Xenorhabdus khoisanae]|uniref:Uncharacterized protein n=1 Tax=Xenorhabdus khoisanae TaxID=880157 RepID=A0A0J5FWE9_9GAMM|nr:hypothetical protein AB204_03310 [Xenorhabdus khoisanae]
MEWLKSDLEKAYSRGKVSILNFHDGAEHFTQKNTDEQKREFKIFKIVVGNKFSNLVSRIKN